MTAWAGYLAQVNLAAGPSVADVDLVLTDAGDHKTFTVPLASARRYLDRAVAVVVQTTLDGSTWTTQSAGNYTLRYLTAQVVLNVALSGGTSYGLRLHAFNYYPYAPILQATDITPTFKRLIHDGTVLQGASGSGWISNYYGLMSATFACKGWMLNPGGQVYAQHLVNSDLLIISFVHPNGTTAVEAYCLIQDTNWHSALDALTDETLTFQSDSVVSLI